MLSNLLLILGVATLSMALRSFNSAVLQKLGALGVFATSFLIGYLLSGYVFVGLICASSWLLLPWLEILTRVRRLRLPADRSLRRKTPPSHEAFPALQDLTEEIEAEGFTHAEDAGWDFEEYQQFYRLFYKASERTLASICMVDQHDIAFYYLSITSRAKDGTIWTTWNYPFSYNLKLAPKLRVNRLRSDQTFLQIHESHREFLRVNHVSPEQLAELDPDQIHVGIQDDLRAQIAHNLTSGLLKRTAEGQIQYSWRGLLFIWLQSLRDIVRL